MRFQDRSTVALLASRFVAPIVLISFAAPLIVVLFYALPATEDFCKATLSFMAVPEPGILSVTWMYFTHWSSRWLTIFLESFLMSRFDLVHAYSWMLLGVIFANVAGLWYFFRTLFRLPRATALLAACVFYAAYVASVGNPVAPLYWLTGAIEYNLSFSTLLILAGLLCRDRRSAWYCIVVVLLSIAAPAQHEIAGALLCTILLGGVLVMGLKNIPCRQWYLSLGATAASLAVVGLSPGNARRTVQQGMALRNVFQFPKWAARSIYHGLGWLSSPSILVGACCIVLLSQGREKPDAIGDTPPKWLAIGGLCGMFAVLFVRAVVETATGTYVPDRAGDWFQFVFWLCLVCAVFGIPEIHRTRFSPGTRIGAFALLAATLLGSWSFRAAVEDLRGPAESWWRIDSVRLQQRGGALEFEAPPPYPAYPKLGTVPQSLSADPACYVNRCMATYLHATSVIVRKSTEECPK